MKSQFNLCFNSLDKTSFVYKLKFINFSDGTLQVQIDDSHNIIKDMPGEILLFARILDSDGIIALYQIKDIIDHYFGDVKTTLNLSYLPYARYDRRMTEYDSHSLKVFGNMINSLKFDRILVDDLHSHVPEGIINNLYQRADQPATFLSTMIKNKVDAKGYDYIISPDNGALKKAQKISREWDIPLMIASKKREESTGYTVFDYLITYDMPTENKKCIIVDDICDGGMTFINLAENLKNQYQFEQVDLFVTHGLFSKGKNLPHLDNIYSFNDFSETIKG